MTFLFALGAFTVFMLALAVGLLLRGRCFTGKCTDHDTLSEEGDTHVCGVCGRTRDADEDEAACAE